MRGKVNDGDVATLAPCKPEELSVGDIVLARVNGWIAPNGIYGIAIAINPKDDADEQGKNQ